MTAPPMIVVYGILLGAYGAYLVWSSVHTRDWMLILWGLVAAAGAVGLLLGRRWSQWIVYPFCAVSLATWAPVLWRLWREESPYADPLIAMLAVVPAVLFCWLCLACAWIVFRRFRRPAA